MNELLVMLVSEFNSFCLVFGLFSSEPKFTSKTSFFKVIQTRINPNKVPKKLVKKPK